jgi:hypothetical protein
LVVWSVVLVALIGAVGCGGSAERATGSTGSTGSTVTSPETTVGTQPVPTTLLPGPGSEAIVNCSMGPFPASALAGPTGAELGDDPLAAALRAYIPGMAALLGGNPDGWRLLTRDDTHALFGLGQPPRMGFVQLTLVDGVWKAGPSTTGECRPRLAVGDVSLASWTLDPRFPYDPAATTLHVLVDELGCHGTESTPPERIRPPEIRDDPTQVTVLITATPLEGDQTCPGPPPTPFVVTLPTPPGQRPLADGAYLPPQRVDFAR